MLIQNSKFKIQRFKSKILKFLLLILPFAFCLLPSSVNAQTIDLGVYPPIIQIGATPPAVADNPISIENFSDQTINLSIIFRPFKPLENGDIEYLEGDALIEYEPLFSNVKVFDEGSAIESITLSPKQKKDLKLRINISQAQKKGDFYFSVIFISDELSDIGSTKSTALGGIASNVLLTLGPKDDPKGRISKFSSPFFLTNGPVPFSLKVSNDSSSYITTNGIITIRDIFGKTVGKIDLLPVNILASSDRLMVSQDVESPDLIWNEKFLLGIYSAKAQIGLSEEGPILSKTITFFALPIELIAAVLISIGIVSYIVKRLRERRYEN